MAETLSQQLAEYRANWRVRVPADRQVLSVFAPTSIIGCAGRRRSFMRPAKC
jgi:hypothetical protein